ncbi:MAG: SCP2 sterol-binding domain-containing protein, partial [Candidatus Omnitrophica bacterium]|nr:SCP2 sterol-binding domain-containing protein [Candidatus Omnitrophota bacterium]
ADRTSVASPLAVKKDLGIVGTKKYKLFSKEQIDEIVRLVNSDEQLKKLGENTNMTMQLAVKLDETAQSYCFEFEKGRIKNTRNGDNAEFVVSAPEKVWRAVFAREIDPFVATTQKKMILKGDFGKISKWYAPCSRLFELWSQVSVE